MKNDRAIDAYTNDLYSAVDDLAAAIFDKVLYTA
jgi:hypothetical protein